MPRLITAIIDRLSMDTVGDALFVVAAAPVAIRQFGDIASQPNTQVARHIGDYELVQLGTLEDDLTITPTRAVLITGEQWKAAQDPGPNDR